MSNPPGYNPNPNGNNPYGGQPYGQPSANPYGQPSANPSSTWQTGSGSDDQTVYAHPNTSNPYQPQSQPSAAGWGQQSGYQSQPSADASYGNQGFGQSQTYQPQSQPSAGAPYAQGYQAPTYAQQPPQSGYGNPPQNYGAPAAYGATPAAPAKKKSPWPWILGIGIPLLVAAIIAAVVLTVVNQDSPQKAMRGYAQALIDGDANKALSYVVNPPADKTMLTDAVLKDLKAHNNGVSAINNVSNSSMSLTVGGRPAMLTPKITKQDGKYKLDTGTVNGTGNFSVPFTLNGVKFKPGDVKIPLFPGVYEIKSDNPNYAFDDDSKFTINSFGYSPSFFEDLKLTDAGQTTAREAVKKSLAACMAQHSLAPAGCPYDFGTPSGGKLDSNTIQVTFDGPNPVDSAKFQTLLGKTSTNFTLRLKVHGSGTTNDGNPGTYDDSDSFYAHPTVDLSTEPATVNWGGR